MMPTHFKETKMQTLTKDEYKVLTLVQENLEAFEESISCEIALDDIKNPLLDAGYSESQISGYMSALEKKGHLSINSNEIYGLEGNTYFITDIDACGLLNVKIEVA
tara:strand:- start:447 stop:764 length:318 start_codon:yes stop_codon:yes gene_type:complete